jgi:flagellar biogenesis protein FliO
MRTFRNLLLGLLLAQASPLAAQFADLPPAERIGEPAPRVEAENRIGPLPFRHAADGASSATAPSEVPLKLAPPSERGKLDRPTPQTPAGALFTVLGSLAVVLGLFFVVVWFTRRALPRAATTLPGEAVQVLGRTPLSGRQTMHVIRFGPKLLLIAVTQNSAATLAEISDAAEVERIAGLCQQNRPGSVSATFRQVLSQFGSEPAPGGFLGTEQPPSRREAAAAPAANPRRPRASAEA